MFLSLDILYKIYIKIVWKKGVTDQKQTLKDKKVGAGQPACLISAACPAYQVHVPVELQSPSEKTT